MPKEIAQHEILLDPEHSQNPQPNLQEVQNQARDQKQSQQERQSILEHLKYKNRLQEYTQRACMQLPVYQTMNEGFPHAPKFRSAVLVDGETYTSPNTFSHRKAAEQDAAKHALEGIAKKIRDKGCSLICEDTTFCKSILNEFAVKMNLERPSYTTTQSEALLPMFFSSLVFHGVTYTGEVGRNKKEAEQLAARAVLLSILGNSDSQTFLFEIIKAKAALFAGIHKFKEPPSTVSNVPVDSNLGSGFGMSCSKEREFDDVTRVGTVVRTAALEASYGQASNHPKMHQPLHELVEQEQVSEGISLPITFVPALQGQPALLSLGSVRKRSRKNKKKPKKKLRSDTQLPVSVLSPNEVSPCTVAH